MGVADLSTCSASAATSTQSLAAYARSAVKVGVPEFLLVARYAGTSTLARVPMWWSIVVVPEFLLASASAGTSSAPTTLVMDVRGRSRWVDAADFIVRPGFARAPTQRCASTREVLRTPCVARTLFPSRLVSTHDGPETAGGGAMRRRCGVRGKGLGCIDGRPLRAPSNQVRQLLSRSTYHVTLACVASVVATRLHEITLGCDVMRHLGAWT